MGGDAPLIPPLVYMIYAGPTGEIPTDSNVIPGIKHHVVESQNGYHTLNYEFPGIPCFGGRGSAEGKGLGGPEWRG